MQKLIILLVAVTLVLSCQQHNAKSTFDHELVRKEAILMLHQYHDAIAEGGLMAEFDYLDSSDDFFWVPPGYQSALNYDSVRSIIEQNSQQFSQVTFSWDTLDIKPLHYSLASFTGIVSGIMIDTAATRTHIRIIESGTLIKRADGWKLLNGQSSLLNDVENTANLPD